MGTEDFLSRFSPTVHWVIDISGKYMALVLINTCVSMGAISGPRLNRLCRLCVYSIRDPVYRMHLFSLYFSFPASA